MTGTRRGPWTTDWDRPGLQLKPIDAEQALDLLRKGRTVSGILVALSVGRSRGAEIIAIGEAAGLVHDARTGRMAPLEDPASAAREAAVLTALALPRQDEAWKDEGLCGEVGDAIFFPEPGGGSAMAVRQAKRICASCPVRPDCLEYAMSVELVLGELSRHGVYGGLTPDERKALQRERDREAIAA